MRLQPGHLRHTPLCAGRANAPRPLTHGQARVWLRLAFRPLLAGACALLVGCSAPLLGGGVAATSDALAANPTQLDVRDLRAEFRSAFCARLPAEADCAATLRRLPGEPSGIGRHRSTTPTQAASAAPDALAHRYRLAFVPGLLAGCAGSGTMPFADAVPSLHSLGFTAQVLSIEGRGSSEHNATLIARQLESTPADARPWIVFGYSKGLPDVLEALARHPALRRNIAAVVSYAGAAGGSRLADGAGHLATALLDHVPLPGCDAGDGTALQSLRRDVRHAWWQAHRAELRLPFYALVAAAQPDRVSAPLQSSYATLSSTGALNDGQLIAADALVPGGALLGYVNADHWAVAMPLSRLPIIGGLFVDDVPRTDLILAAVQVISHDTARTHERTPRF